MIDVYVVSNLNFLKSFLTIRFTVNVNLKKKNRYYETFSNWFETNAIHVYVLNHVWMWSKPHIPTTVDLFSNYFVTNFTEIHFSKYK